MVIFTNIRHQTSVRKHSSSSVSVFAPWERLEHIKVLLPEGHRFPNYINLGREEASQAQ